MNCKFFLALLLVINAFVAYEAKKNTASASSSSNAGNGNSASSSSSSQTGGGGGNGGSQHSSFSSSASSVSSQCDNGKGRTCVNNNCVDRCFSGVKADSGCPAAVCEDGCSGFVVGSDNCPICKCDGFATRELCKSDGDCASGGKCTKNACRYPPVSGSAPTSCYHTRDCKAKEKCSKSKCVSASKDHVEDLYCVFHNQCPSGYTCDDDNNCVNTGTPHTSDTCTSDSQCNDDESCSKMTCIKS